MPCSETDAANFRRRGITGRGIGIGQLDTGADAPCLAGRIDAFLATNPNGLGGAEGAPLDSGWHGTAMARIMVDEDEGIAPGARLSVAAVLNDGNVLARILLGLDWMVGRRPAVLALPLGVPSDAALFADLIAALAARDVLIVAAVGNGGAGRVLAPAASEHVLAVGSVESADRVAAFSGSALRPRGSTCAKPDVVFGSSPGFAPAVANARAVSGTSVSTARLAGYCALIREAHPGRTADEIRHALERTATPVADDFSHRVRLGLAHPHLASHALDVPRRTAPACGAPRTDVTIADRTTARLDERLRRADADAYVDAIVGFASRRARDAALSSLSTAGVGDAPREQCCRALKHAPILVLRTRVATLAAMLERFPTTLRSTCDIDRAWFDEPALSNIATSSGA